MSKVRVGHKELFIAHLTNTDHIPERFHFDFNHKWVVNNSYTKRIVVRKIKAYQMNLIAEVWFAIDASNGTQQHMQIHYEPINNLPISILLIDFVRKIKMLIDTLYTGRFPSRISYLWADYITGKSTLTFINLIKAHLNSVIVFAGDSFESFNI
jgi:hypothetical protein